MREKESENPLFDITDRDFNVKAYYLTDTIESKGDALCVITKNGSLVKEFIYPAYKIFNIGAHFSDIVDSELRSDDAGYKIAGSTGLGGYVAPELLKESES